jgi:hypothetical protein
MRSKYFLFLIICLLHFPKIIEAQEYYIRFFENDKDKVNTVVTRTVSIDKVEDGIVYAYANEQELEKIKSVGYQPEELPHPSSYPRALNMATTVAQMANWDRYPTYDVYRAMMKKFQQDHPTLCKLDSIGTTVQGRKLYIIKISDNVLVDEAEPEFFYTSTMHGDETTGFALMLRLIDYLLVNYGTDDRVTSMVNNLAIYINPNANPDGTYYSGNNTVSGARRYNANSVDLNRNFPYIPSGGPTPQPETTIMMNFANDRNFVLSANIHGGIELVNFPWDTWTSSTNSHADHNWFYTISRQYADLAQANSPAGYFTGEDNGVTHGGDWYVVDGGRQDFMNYFHHCREVTLEISNTKLLGTEYLNAFWNYNKESMLTYIERLYTGIHGFVKNEQEQPLAATITVLNHDKDNSHVVTNPLHGNYVRMIAPGTWSVSYSAEGYVSQVHSLTVSNNNSLVVHNVVLAQAEQTTLSGVITDAESDAPIEGAKVELLGTTIEPAFSDVQGNYSFGSITENVYQIKVSKTGYLSQTVTESLTGDENIIDFAIWPTNAESFESEIPQGFTFTGGNWIRDNSTAFDGDYSMKSATIGSSSQTAMQITLNISSDGAISFARRVSSESGYDYLKFYIDGVQKGSWSGNQNWDEVTYPVSSGSRTFKWEYSKDGSVSSGSDCAWVDNIIFPQSFQNVTFTVTSSGSPVVGAAVNFNQQTLNTNSAGVATFTGVNRGVGKPYTVSKSGFSTSSGTVDVQYVSVNQPVTMEPISVYYMVTFYVSGPQGLIEGATVTLNGNSQITNANGEAIFEDIPEGTYSYSIEAPGFLSQQESVLVDENKTIFITLVPEPEHYSVTFIVVDDQEIGIQGATIVLGENQLETNSNGEAIFINVEAGTYEFYITAGGYTPQEGLIIVDNDKTIVITLETVVLPFDVTFVVVDNQEHVIEGATVTFNGSSLSTNSNGEVVFINIEAGVYSYVVIADGYIPQEGLVTVDSNETIVITLETVVLPFDVTFVVVDNQEHAIEGATVTFNGSSLSTNSNGEVVFTSIEAGVYNYSVDAEGYIPQEGVVVVNEDKLITIILEVAVELFDVTFFVHDSQGVPINSAIVDFGESNGNTNEEGIVIFTDNEAGNYNYSIAADGFHLLENTVFISSDSTFNVILIPSSNPFLHSNYHSIELWPNPFSRNLNIKINLSGATLRSIEVYSITGQRVTTISDLQSAGNEYHCIWNGKNTNGYSLPYGVYILKVHTSYGIIAQRVLFTP